MNAIRSLVAALVVASSVLAAPAAEAQQTDERRFFIEGNIGGGISIGDVDYLPAGDPGDWSFPVVYGWAFGGTLGYMLHENIGFFGSYTHSRNETRDGQISGLVDRVEGRLNYNAASAGLRLLVPLGIGSIRGDLGVAVIFPHARVRHYEYAPTIGQFGFDVEGTGRQIENFSVGLGAHGRLGYQIPIYGPIYVAGDAELQIFQSENSGETTEYENFVDFEQSPPTVRNDLVLHGDGAAQPQTASVQNVRLMFSVGAQF